jgi:beta-glucanase (GH16 family)
MKIYKILHILIIISFMTVSGTLLSGCDGNGPTSFPSDQSSSSDTDDSSSSNNSYKLVFEDEFNGDSLDTTVWNYETGYGPYNNGWGNNEWQLYTSNAENVKVTNDCLVISAISSGTPSSDKKGDKDDSITSGRINSLLKKTFLYGKIQARMKIPYKHGIWSAFWMMGNSFVTDSWPKCGEIDIMETFAHHLENNQNQGTLHWFNEETDWTHPTDTNPKKCDSTAYHELEYPYPNVGNFSAPLDEDYHIYEVEWDVDKIIWRVDGIDFYWEYIKDSHYSEFHKDFFIIFNVAVGGNLGGSIDHETFFPNDIPTKRELMVDWVRVYQKDINIGIYSETLNDNVLEYKRIFGGDEWSGDESEINSKCLDVTPFDGDHVLSVEYISLNNSENMNYNKKWSGVIFEFSDAPYYSSQVFKYASLVFSIDISAIPNLADMGIKFQDDSRDSAVQLSNYSPETNDNWSTYEIPINDFSQTDLTKLKYLIFQEPKDANGNMIYGKKLYLDNIYFKVENNCAASVLMDKRIYNDDDSQATITVNDYCMAGKDVQVTVENGDTSILVDVKLDENGRGIANLNFGVTNDSVDRILIQQDDTLEISYLDSKDNAQSYLAFIIGSTSDPKSELGAALSDANDLIKSVEPGKLPGQVPESDLIAFNSAVASAQSILDNSDQSHIAQDVISSTYFYLANAKNAFEAAIIEDKQFFTLISSNPDIQSDVEMSDSTVGEWSTGTDINPEGVYKEKNCWVLTSGTKPPAEGNWGAVLAFQNGINGDFSDYAKLNVTIATSGDFNEYKVTIVQDTGDIPIILLVDNSTKSWQNFSEEVSGLNTIKQIAICGVGGVTGTSKIYISDFYLAKGNNTISKSSLISSVSAANTLLNATGIGSAVGQVSNDDAITYSHAIATAQSVIDNIVASQVEVDNALTALESATNAFKAAKIIHVEKAVGLISSGSVPEQITVNALDTGTIITKNVEHQGKSCLELTSGDKGTALSIEGALTENYSDYNKLSVSIATSGGYTEYLAIIYPDQKKRMNEEPVEIVLPVDDTKDDWQDVSVDISGVASIKSVAIVGKGGESGASKIYISDIKIVKVTTGLDSQDFVIISSDISIESDVVISDSTVGEWSTGTVINPEGVYEGKNCWELTSSTKSAEEGNWGTVLAFQDGINGDFSMYKGLSVSIATTGGYIAYKVSIVPQSGSNIDIVLPVNDEITSWQDFSVSISGLTAIKQIAIFGEGGEIGISKIHVTDFKLLTALPQDDEYKLVFSDEFDGDSLDTSVWNHETGYGSNGWGNDEWQLYTSDEENVRVENGNLIISARTSGNNGIRDGSITSGRINTMGKKAFKYGKIQARIKFPYQLGLWPAYWMLGASFSTEGWPKCGEIDIMETFAQYLSENQNQGMLHWWNEDNNEKTDSIAYNNLSYPFANVGEFSVPLHEDFHVYEIEWDTEKIVWKVDGVGFYSESITDSNKSEFHKEHFIIFNLAVGGNLGGTVDENTFPLDDNNNPTPRNLYVDWVRVYQKEIPADLEFVVISSDSEVESDVVISASTVGEWSTGTHINTEGLFEDRNCWELTSSTKTTEEGNWGTVLAFQDGINGDFSNYSELKVSIATTGKYIAYKVVIVPQSGSNIDVILPVNDEITSWQDISVNISGLTTIKQIAIFGEGGDIGVSKIYITDFKLVGGNETVSKTALIEAISTANTLLNTTVVGNADGQVSEADATTFANAITAAQAVNNKDDATQDEINAAFSALTTATKSFQAAIIVEEEVFVIISSDLNIQSDVDITDSTVGEWSTGTQINPDGTYEGKNCWELTSNGSWGTVLAFQDGIDENFSDYSNLKVSVATTGGYNDYKVAFVPTSGSTNKEFPLPVNDAITSWQDISVEISGLSSVKQIAVIGGGGNAGTSKIYVTDFTLETGNSGTVTQKFVIIPSDANTQSDVAFSNDTVGEWSTGTTSNGEAEFKDKKCWELTSGSKTAEQGNWGTVLVFQNGINGDFSQYSKIKVNIATTGDYSAYKLSLSACGVGKEVVLPIDNQVAEWQNVSIDIIDIPLNLKSIDFIAVLGVGGTPGTSKFYVTDFEIVKDKEVTLAEIDDDYILKSSDPNINTNLIVDGDNNSDTGNIIFGEWGTQTKLDDATCLGLDCWKLTAVAGWGAVLALQGDISDGTNIDNYDVDLSKYTNIKFKIASEGSFERYALSIGSSVNGNSVSQEVGFSLKDQTSWNEIDIDLDNYGVDLSNVSQMALFGVYPGGAAAGQKIYITDFIIYDTGIVGSNEKDSSDDKFVFKSSTDEQVDIVVDGDDCAHNGNITINDWSTNTGLQETEYKGLNCWELTKGNGWGAVLALMGDMYGDVMTYDLDLTKYSSLNLKIAAEGAFAKYWVKLMAGAEFGKEYVVTDTWKDISINFDEIPLNLLKLQQIAIYGEGGNAGDKLYITDLNISK